MSLLLVDSWPVYGGERVRRGENVEGRRKGERSEGGNSEGKEGVRGEGK